jgi:hypothetical protein
MASSDHTTRVRLVVRNEPNSKSTSSRDGKPPRRGSDEESHQAYVAKVADTALAVAVLEGMLQTHEAFRKKYKNGEKSGLLPFNTVQLIGLTAAIDLLHQHVDMLALEQRG